MPRVISDEEEKKIARALVDQGNYLIEVQECKDIAKDGGPLTDKHGNEMWNMKLAICDEGVFWGKIIWDNIVFSEALAQRTKSIFNAFGFDTAQGFVAENTQMLVGHSAIAKIVRVEYNGQEKNAVKFFDGYFLPGEKATGEKSETDLDDLPF